jgi:hypothetical protein
VTPDGRYFVIRGRLWRMANPDLDDAERADLVGRLMAARRAVPDARKRADREAEAAARKAVDEVKRALGERGPVWWDGCSPDSTGTWQRTRHMLTDMRDSLAPTMEDFELPKAAIFDLDGTLLDSVDLHATAWQEAMLEFGHDVSFEQARSQIGKGGCVEIYPGPAALFARFGNSLLAR